MGEAPRARVALVTGSARGLGEAIALRLAEDGVDVIVHSRVESRRAAAVVQAVEARGRRSHLVAADLRHPEQVEALFECIRERWGRLDILVNNAALASFAPATALTLRQWDTTLAASVRGPLLCVQAAAPLMTGGWGRIVNISSLGSMRYVPHYGAMAAAKAALEALTRSLAVELAPRGIGVNAVAAGLLRTGSMDFFPPAMKEHAQEWTRRCPPGRIGEPGDVADVVAFLCSEGARWIVGQTLVVDGGFSLW